MLVGSTTDGQVCLINGPASSCGPNAYAQTAGLVLIVQCDHGNPGVKRTITVLVPDGAAAPTLKDNGKPTRELSVVRNVAYTEDTSADEVTQANGTAVKLPPLSC